MSTSIDRTKREIEQIDGASRVEIDYGRHGTEINAVVDGGSAVDEVERLADELGVEVVDYDHLGDYYGTELTLR